ncbi:MULTISPECIES: asparagine synthase (glutamine-hydrolyzing) [unclassified Streptomyces]|uniref:asparagine synthase (glutamine-hydrolyzing) n=1 Tax=unclassified Streptomyces TaxID=2593676 RepID=UPI000DC7BB63|nr:MULTISPECIES: asparagine synthase (glutamine-hydrolyzing) [unclassified Streptomyces]AWZ05905.1 asparagine synthase (glutamine-hydrolyzing) [Streptomyces sp. ICC4]AWZ11952.1 asparagine synthase (glutamine-hydrolyzing) [Streptomyces sp. ICC1]
MCRIYGSFNAGTSDQELRTVAALLRHGGPDAQTYTGRADWALGNNRLSIIDPEGGGQPYRLGAVTVVFNGELYNHRELAARLEARGHLIPDRCDGSVLPALYLEYGERFAEQLDGMYSVAVMDLREEPKLVVATDGSGMKPLYYAWDERGGQFRFASEIPALLGFADVTAEEDEFGLDAYLVSKTPFGDRTMFRGIRVLPPAATAVVGRRGGLRITTRPLGHTEAVADPSRSLHQAGEELRELLSREVSRLLIADAPVAAITSGGLDSSLVTVLAARSAADLHTFNIAYTGDWPGDERAFAAEVAGRAGTVHHQVEVDPATFPDLLADVVWHLGQPNADPITLSTFSLFRAVRDAGFKVALTGDAADELFGGYARMTQAMAAPGGLGWVQDYLDHLSAVPRALRERLYTDEYTAAVRAHGPALPAGLTETLENGAGTRMRRICAIEQEYRLPSYHLRRVDHLSMASSVEARLPFCQPDVVRFATTLTDAQKIDTSSAGGVKRALYAAARGLVPDSVLNRPKQPFTLPINAMLRPGQALWDVARDALSESALRADGRIRPEVVSGLFEEQAARPSDGASLALWALMSHQMWRSQFFGPTAPNAAAAAAPRGAQ